MARGVNKAIIVGTLGQDPEVRYTANGGAVANISVATNENWRDKTTGEAQERTEWHRVSFFNRLAEIAGEYLRKGSKVYVEGALQTRKWTDQNGVEKYSTEIVLQRFNGELQMLDSRGDNSGGTSFESNRDTGGSRAMEGPKEDFRNADLDDEIPF